MSWRPSAHNHWHRHSRRNLDPPLAAVLSSNISEQFDEQVIVLLSGTSLAIVGRGVLELNSLEGCFSLRRTWALTETGIVQTA
jgi:hypothetical protein